jgi:hypothetical protein
MGGRFAAGRGGEEEREDGEGKARERLKGRETREGEREGRGREGKGHREGRDRKVGEGKGAGADGIAGGQNVSTPQHKLLVAPLGTQNRLQAYLGSLSHVVID